MLTNDQRDEAMANRPTPNHVTWAMLQDKVDETEFIVRGVLTVCFMTMANGFSIIGKAAPADPENFDKALGEKLAFDDAIRQAWPLEGYLLRQRLHEEAE